MIEWTFALLFRPDVVKVSLDSEAALLIRETNAGAAETPAPPAGRANDSPKGQP
jgi:hypothetical protein